MLCRCQLLFIALLLVAHAKTLEKRDGVLTKERFLLFSRRCILRNTADLLLFILHRFLSLTTVKIIWPNAFSFNSPVRNKFGINVDRRYRHPVRAWNQEKQISVKKFWNLSDFELKFSNATDFETKFLQCVRFCIRTFTTRTILDWKQIQRVRFWIEKIRTRQILDQLFYNTSDFELNFLLCVRFWVYFFCSLPNFPVFIITGHVSVMS